MKQTVTPFDLIRYPSLRTATITLSIGYLGMDFFYSAPSSAINKVGINPILNGILLGAGSLIGLPISYLVVARTPRRLYGIFFNLFSCICGLGMVFIKVPP